VPDTLGYLPPIATEHAAGTLADQLVLALAAAGITTYFGVPGGAIEPLFDALARHARAGRVRIVPTRGEAAAGFAADGYYRATGRIAVCTGTTGPGASNLLTPVMSAHADRIPVLVLSPQVALAKQGRGALQESSPDGYDLPAMFERHLRRRCADRYRVAMGLSSMCWAIGAAVGAAVGTSRRTICVTGDGAWLMSSLELTVAVEQHLPITFIILNDRGLGMVRHGQRLGGAESVAHDIAPVRFDRVAEACGAAATRITSADELGQIPAAWLDDDTSGPCVIDVEIDREAVPPMADRVVGLATGVPR